MKKKTQTRKMLDGHKVYSDNDELDDFNYQPSDSDDAYTETERKLLDKARHIDSGDNDSEEEVFGIHSDGDDTTDNEDINDINMDSDIEGNEEANLPNVRAWGKSKRTFYSTDYVDEDYGGFQGKDAQEADYEEQEARAIQHRLAQQLDDADFSLDFFVEDTTAKEGDAQEKLKVQEKEQVKTDLSSLSKRQKLDLLQKESPEFLSLVHDFNEQMQEIGEKLEPVLLLLKEGKLPTSPATYFIKTRYHLILNYCTNILFYLLLKARRVPVQSHPIVRRLMQYRKLLQQLDPLWTDIVKPQCNQLLETISKGEDIVLTATNISRKAAKKLLKLLKPTSTVSDDKERLEAVISSKAKSKKGASEISKTGIDGRVSLPQKGQFDDCMEEQEHIDEADGDSLTLQGGDESVQEGSKRAITYQIAKNKGLTPHRKREQRNPRVKNRNKYRKALIRRKGQVRNVRTEVERYGGEIFGIKARVKKGIKIKV